MDLLDKVGEAVEGVADAAKEGVLSAAIMVAQEKVKEHTGLDITIEAPEIPSDWLDWMRATGINSLCTEDSWDFLENGSGCEKRLQKWKDYNIKKIVLAIQDESKLDDYEKRWWVSIIDAKEGVMTINWCPRAKTWSSDNMWTSPGYKKWWILRDSIVFGLELYELEGKCFYKSGWVDDFEDVDPNSCLPNGTTKYKRWLQFRHWTMLWFEKAMEGWNYQHTKKPPKPMDGLDFSLDNILDLPDMPSMPSISFPNLPDIEMPSMPSVDLPSIDPSMPSIDPSMPSFDPSMSMPSMEDRKERPRNRWACHGIIELNGLKVKASGSSIILSDATVHHFWQDGDHHIDTEKKEHQRFELKATSADQATSWFESLIEVKCEEGDMGGCCTIA